MNLEEKKRLLRETESAISQILVSGATQVSWNGKTITRASLATLESLRVKYQSEIAMEESALRGVDPIFGQSLELRFKSSRG